MSTSESADVDFSLFEPVDTPSLIFISCKNSVRLTAVALIPTTDANVSGQYEEPIATVRLPQAKFDNLVRDLKSESVESVRITCQPSVSDIKPVTQFKYVINTHVALKAVDEKINKLQADTTKAFHQVAEKLEELKRRIDRDRGLPNGRHSPLELASQKSEAGDDPSA